MKWFPGRKVEPDAVETAVAQAVAAARPGDRGQIEDAYRALAPLNTGDVLAELCVCIDQILDGVSLDALRAVPGIRFLPNASELAAAAQKSDLVALGVAVVVKTNDRVLASLLVLVAQLRDAPARL